MKFPEIRAELLKRELYEINDFVSSDIEHQARPEEVLDIETLLTSYLQGDYDKLEQPLLRLKLEITLVLAKGLKHIAQLYVADSEQKILTRAFDRAKPQ